MMLWEDVEFRGNEAGKTMKLLLDPGAMLNTMRSLTCHIVNISSPTKAKFASENVP